MSKKLSIPTFIFFILAVLIISYVSPREAVYKYSYAVNRPWQYGLLTAPFKFYVHKSNSQVEAEKDSITNSFQPYYYFDSSIPQRVIENLAQEKNQAHLSDAYINYIREQLTTIYKSGIISKQDFNKIQHSGLPRIHLRSVSNIVVLHDAASFYTPKSAYEKILNELPEHLSIVKFKTLDLNDYLQINVLFDEKTWGNIQEQLLQQVALYEGEVQSGEKIIDRGEIVTPHIKNVLDSYTTVMQGKSGIKFNPLWSIVGNLVMNCILIAALMFYLIFFRPREYFDKKHAIFILLMVFIPTVIMGLMASSKMYVLIYLIPFTIPTILTRTFVDSRTSLTTHLVTVLMCALMLPVQQMAQFIVLQMLVGYMVVFSLRNLSERSQLLHSAFLIFITYVVAYTGWQLCTEGDILQIKESGRLYLYFAVNLIFVTFAYLLVYICEKVFGFISEVSMVELSNTNRPLLQKLSEVAPGTFQHSMQVSTLVFAAAHQIGANASLARTGALYHDIGKMLNPIFYTENQLDNVNVHFDMTEKESAKIIIQHVHDGVELAKKHKLPQQIIDFIETHHGKGRTKYFYNSYVNKHPDEEVNPADFAYPGPNPFTKETALLMIADGVEAASRSMKDNSKEAITTMVNRLVDSLISEGLLKNAPLTFKEIEIAKNIFVDKLVSMYHMRVAYPELQKKKS